MTARTIGLTYTLELDTTVAGFEGTWGILYDRQTQTYWTIKGIGLNAGFSLPVGFAMNFVTSNNPPDDLTGVAFGVEISAGFGVNFGLGSGDTGLVGSTQLFAGLDAGVQFNYSGAYVAPISEAEIEALGLETDFKHLHNALQPIINFMDSRDVSIDSENRTVTIDGVDEITGALSTNKYSFNIDGSLNHVDRRTLFGEDLDLHVTSVWDQFGQDGTPIGTANHSLNFNDITVELGAFDVGTQLSAITSSGVDGISLTGTNGTTLFDVVYRPDAVSPTDTFFTLTQPGTLSNADFSQVPLGFTADNTLVTTNYNTAAQVTGSEIQNLDDGMSAFFQTNVTGEGNWNQRAANDNSELKYVATGKDGIPQVKVA